MNQLRRLTLSLALLFAVAPLVLAQQREPHIGYVYPAGGQQGTTFEVMVGGQFLNGTTNAYVSGAGVRAVVTPFEPVINFKQAMELRDRAMELRKKEKTADVIKELLEIRRKLAAFEKKRQAPALAESIPVRITIAANAPPGNRELRLGSFTGLSNPLVFQVGQLPECREAEPKPDDEVPTFKSLKNPKSSRPSTTATNSQSMAMPITLPTTVNGQIMPGDVDRYRFKARQGQQLVVAVSARELIPYLADAVPGWFQAKVVLYDATGKELTYDDHYRFHPDPVLFYTIPKEGEYVLEIKDSLYRGREDFVYRIAVGELPFIANVYPLGGRAGTQTTVAIWGWNLPVNKHTLDLTGIEPGLYPFTVVNKGQVSNRMPFFVDTLPECFKIAPSDTPTNAQLVTTPIIINGRIEHPGDVDVFRFEGRAGAQLVAEVFARRLDSPLDSVLKLTDAAGKQLAFNDDHEDKGSGLNTHHADSYLTATLPANGMYFLYIWDAQQKGGWAYGYRLRISAPRPDFELRAVPSSLSARPGGSTTITVFALRRDGFTGDIAISLKDAPEGVKLSPGTLTGTQEQVKVTLSLSAKLPKTPFDVLLQGRATPHGGELIHTAVPADDMMQAFAFRHLVPAKEMKVLVASTPPARPAEKKIAKDTPATPAPATRSVKIPAGGSARVQVKLATTSYSGKLQLELEEPPDGITIKEFSPTRDGAELVLQADAAKIKAGQKGELTVTAFAERKSKLQPAKPHTPLGTIPPIQYEITAQSAKK